MPKKPEVVEKAVARAGTSSVSVYNGRGEFIRSYSAEAHGENFIQLAEGFAKKVSGTVRK